jgi:hypothetical protein
LKSSLKLLRILTFKFTISSNNPVFQQTKMYHLYFNKVTALFNQKSCQQLKNMKKNPLFPIFLFFLSLTFLENLFHSVNVLFEEKHKIKIHIRYRNAKHWTYLFFILSSKPEISKYLYIKYYKFSLYTFSVFPVWEKSFSTQIHKYIFILLFFFYDFSIITIIHERRKKNTTKKKNHYGKK